MKDCVGQCAGKGGDQNCLCGGSGSAKDAALYLQKRLLRAEEALSFYAEPDTYFAVAFFADPPCGGFMEDFSDTGELGVKPGKLARETLSTEVPR